MSPRRTETLVRRFSALPIWPPLRLIFPSSLPPLTQSPFSPLRLSSHIELVSPSRATSIRPNLRKAPTAPNAATDGFPTAYPSRANSQGPPGTRTPYISGDAPPLSRLPLKDLLLNPKKKLASDVGLTWKVAFKNLFFSSWLNIMVSRSLLQRVCPILSLTFSSLPPRSARLHPGVLGDALLAPVRHPYLCLLVPRHRPPGLVPVSQILSGMAPRR